MATHAQISNNGIGRQRWSGSMVRHVATTTTGHGIMRGIAGPDGRHPDAGTQSQKRDETNPGDYEKPLINGGEMLFHHLAYKLVFTS